MRTVRRLVLAAAVMVSAVVVAPVTAEAGIWHDYPTAVNRTCSSAEPFNGAKYQVCLDFNANRTQVRTVAFISPGGSKAFQVNIRLRFGGGPDITDSCPTMTGSSPRACYTAFTAVRTGYMIAEATFGIDGTWMATLRALDTRLSIKQQQNGYYCGPAAVQTVLATIGISAPSQQTLDEKMGTNTVYGTHPRDIEKGLNPYIPDTDWQYHDHYSPSDYAQVGDEIVTSLSRGKPVILLVKPKDLPWSSSASDVYRHYIVVHGFGGVVGEGRFRVETFKVADPWSATEHSIALGALFNAADNAWTFSDIARIRT